MTELEDRILYSENKAYADFPGEGTLNDKLNFGFSFVECQDHFVEYVVANPKMMTKILREIEDSAVDPGDGTIGKLWTASLVVSKKMRDEKLVFSNGGHTAVLFLDLNPYRHKIGGLNAKI